MAEIGTVTARFNADTSGFKRGAKEVQGLIDQYGRRMENDSANRLKETNAQQAAYKKTAQSLNPMIANSKKLAQETEALHKGFKLNNTSQTEQARLLDLLNKKYINTSGGMGTFNKQMRISRFATGNLAAQFNDIGVMLAAGQSPFTLAIQQGTQVSQVLNQMGSKKEMVAALGQSFTTFLNPVSLVTVAVIAGGAALFSWARASLGAGMEAERLAERVGKVVEKFTDMQDEIRALRLGVSDDELAILDKVTASKQRIIELETLRASAGRRGVRVYRALLVEEQQSLKTTEEQLSTFRTLRYERERYLNGVVEEADAERQVSESLQESGEYKRETNEIMKKLVANLSRAQKAALAFAGIDISGFVTVAADEAGRLAENLAIAQSYGTSEGGEFGPDALEAFGGGGAYEYDLPSTYKPTKKKAARSGGGGRKRGGKSVREEAAERLKALQESFATETELQIKRFADEEQVLRAALTQKLLTQEEFQQLMEKSKRAHEEKMAVLDVWRHGSTLEKTQQFMGDMASALSTGNERMLQIGKAFGAANALLNAWKAFSDAMGDASLPWYAKLSVATSLFASAVAAVSAIKGIGEGGSGQRSVGGGGGGAVGAAQAPAPQSSRVALSLQGDIFGRDQVISLINKINEAQEDGAIIRVV